MSQNKLFAIDCMIQQLKWDQYVKENYEKWITIICCFETSAEAFYITEISRELGVPLISGCLPGHILPLLAKESRG